MLSFTIIEEEGYDVNEGEDIDSRPMMLSFSKDSSVEISNWKLSSSFLNLNGSMSILPSEDRAAAKWLGTQSYWEKSKVPSI